jgi:hypothetical protein
LVITKFNGKAADAGCAWDHVKTVNIPAEANFEDYSDLALSGNQVPPDSHACNSSFIIMMVEEANFLCTWLCCNASSSVQQAPKTL